MAIENPNKVKVSRRVASVWVVISMAVAVLIGIVGMAMIKEGALAQFDDSETIIIQIATLLSKVGVVPALLSLPVFSQAQCQPQTVSSLPLLQLQVKILSADFSELISAKPLK